MILLNILLLFDLNSQKLGLYLIYRIISDFFVISSISTINRGLEVDSTFSMLYMIKGDLSVQNNDLILELIKKRLKVGAEQYHQNVPIMPKDDITRDNFYEAVEEALDLSVYLAAYMLRLMEEKERREFEPTTADEHNKKEDDENRKEKESST